jgi:hypothetical protein
MDRLIVSCESSNLPKQIEHKGNESMFGLNRLLLSDHAQCIIMPGSFVSSLQSKPAQHPFSDYLRIGTNWDRASEVDRQQQSNAFSNLTQSMPQPRCPSSWAQEDLPWAHNPARKCGWADGTFTVFCMTWVLIQVCSKIVTASCVDQCIARLPSGMPHVFSTSGAC